LTWNHPPTSTIYSRQLRAEGQTWYALTECKNLITNGRHKTKFVPKEVISGKILKLEAWHLCQKHELSSHYCTASGQNRKYPEEEMGGFEVRRDAYRLLVFLKSTVSYAEVFPSRWTFSTWAVFKGAILVEEIKPKFSHKLTPTMQHCSKAFSATQVLTNSFRYAVQTFKIYQESWLGWGASCFHLFRSILKHHLLFKEKNPSRCESREVALGSHHKGNTSLTSMRLHTEAFLTGSKELYTRFRKALRTVSEVAEKDIQTLQLKWFRYMRRSQPPGMAAQSALSPDVQGPNKLGPEKALKCSFRYITFLKQR